MTPEEIGRELNEVAAALGVCVKKLGKVYPHLVPIDKAAVKRIITDLNWGTENCTVVALHQHGLATDDNMGITETQAAREIA